MAAQHEARLHIRASVAPLETFDTNELARRLEGHASSNAPATAGAAAKSSHTNEPKLSEDEEFDRWLDETWPSLQRRHPQRSASHVRPAAGGAGVEAGE